MFDGVHLGHQRIIGQALADARACGGLALAITFDRHPNEVVAPQHAPLLIQPLLRRARDLEALGMDTVLLLHFDRPFSEQTGEVFVRNLVNELGGVRSFCVGADFVFGHRRSGDVALLERLGRELDFTVRGLTAVLHEGQPVSSTRIREAIRGGDFPLAAALLGRPYALTGRVVAGDRVGRELGFPTANLDVTGLVLPPFGVHAVWARFAGREHPAVLNLGFRPTLAQPAPQLRVEVHLLDFDGDLYGKAVDVRFVARLRSETRFASRAELQAQIAKDVQGARRALADHE